jgi:hypothetical protein
VVRSIWLIWSFFIVQGEIDGIVTITRAMWARFYTQGRSHLGGYVGASATAHLILACTVMGAEWAIGYPAGEAVAEELMEMNERVLDIVVTACPNAILLWCSSGRDRLLARTTTKANGA